MGRWMRWAGRALVYGALGAGSVVMLLPLAWMTSSALKPLYEVMRIPPTWIPQEPTLDNFRAVFAQFPFGRYFLNSLITATGITLSVVLTSAMAGYALAKFDFPGRNFLFLLILSSLMIPFQTQVAISLRLQDTLLGVMFPWLVGAFGIFLMRQFMLTIPSDLIDGASEARILWTIMLPLVRPALAALAIFPFLGAWEEFLWPLIITSSDASRTIPVGLQFFSEQYGTNIHWQMAGALIAALPMLAVFFLLQRQIIEGIALTGLKG